MRTLKHLFRRNRAWAQGIRAHNVRFFQNLSRQQRPKYFWIGCADSRVPANQIIGLLPGEVFVHRNLANVVAHTDLNCLSVLQFAVDVLRVRHVIVCGHYGCGGVCAALRGQRLGLADHWLRHVRDVRDKHLAELAAMSGEEERWRRLCELNVVEQVLNVCRTPIVATAWTRGQPLAVHGWIYGLGDGLLRDLKMCVTGPREVMTAYKTALHYLHGSPEPRR
jgi:carbonic anhydrase